MNGRLLLVALVAACVGILGTIAVTHKIQKSDAADGFSRDAMSKGVEEELARQLPAAVAREVRLQAEESARKLAAENAILYARAEKRARGDSLESILQTVRTQLELYRIQHDDRFPTLAQLSDWSTLVIATDRKGRAVKPDSRDSFGPYLQRAPVNPFTLKSGVVAPEKASRDAGWVWEQSTGTLRAIVPESELEDYREVPAEKYFTVK